MVDNSKNEGTREVNGELFSKTTIDRMYHIQQQILRAKARIAELDERVNLLRPGLSLIKPLGGAAAIASEYNRPTHNIMHLKTQLSKVLEQLKDPKLCMPAEDMAVLIGISTRQYDSAEKLKSDIVQFMMARMDTVASYEIAISNLESTIEDLERDLSYHVNRLADTNCDYSSDPDFSRPGLTF